MITRQPGTHPAGAYDYYNSTSTGAFSASSTGSIHDFGFTARYLRIDNISGKDIWARLDGAFGSTSIASTASILIGTCADHRTLALSDVPVARVQLYSTNPGEAYATVLAVG